MPDNNHDLRRTILDTSRRMLVNEGFTNLSMRKIATECDCSATSIYLYFKNKDALLHALIEEGFELLFEKLKAVDDSQRPPLDRANTICREFIDFGLGNPEYYEIMFQLHPRHMERYPVEKFRKARKNIDLIMYLLEDGSKKGDFLIEEPRVVANVILATIHGAVSLLNAGRIDSRVGKEAFVETVVASVLAGLKGTVIMGKDQQPVVS